MSKFVLSLLTTTLISGAAYADLNCDGRLPTCSEMGYSKDNVTDCTNYLYCPFDPAYKICTSCIDGDDGVCTDGKILSTDCTAKGGIGLAGTHVLNPDGTYCVECQTCPTDYKMVFKGQTSNYENCLSDVYSKFDGGALYQCCPVCTKDTMLAEECDAEGGVLRDYSIDENKCGTCVTCEEQARLAGKTANGWTLIKKGEWNNKKDEWLNTQYETLYINYKGSSSDADFCIRETEGCSCYQGTPVTSADQITDGGDYCVAINGTLTVELPMKPSQKSGTYHFYKSSCPNATLRIPNTLGSTEGAGATLSGSLTSEVYTEVGSVDKNTWLHTITLTNGGKLIRNASDGTADITIKNGRSYTFKALGACSGAKRKVKCDGIERGLKLILESQDADLTAITSCFDFSGCQNADCSLNGKDGKINSDGECK